MTIRRRHAPGHIAFTKGHSALRQRTYGVPGRRTGLESDDLLCETYVPRPVMPGLRKVHHSHESDYLTSQVDRASYLSHATLDEADDIVSVSRARDQQLLQSANSAIVKGGAPSTMKALVATKRVTGSTPPARVYQPYQYAAPPPPLRKVGREVAIKSVSEKPIIYFLPSSDSSSPRKPVIIARSNTGASAQSTTGFGQVEKLTREVARPIAEAKEIAARSLVKQRAAVNYSARLKRRHETVVQKQPEVLRVKKHPPLPHYTLPKKSGRKGRRSQAALVAGKVDIERSSRRSRRPKSQYAAEKYRQIRIDQAQDSPKTTSASGGDAAGSKL